MKKKTGKGFEWGEEEDRCLRRLHAKGRNCSQISEILFELGFPMRSRNAVIGRLQRLGLSQARKRNYSAKGRGLRSDNNRPDRCQWPHGDPGRPDFHFCGAAPAPGRPYCPEHCARAYSVKAPEAEAA